MVFKNMRSYVKQQCMKITTLFYENERIIENYRHCPHFTKSTFKRFIEKVSKKWVSKRSNTREIKSLRPLQKILIWLVQVLSKKLNGSLIYIHI